MDVCINIECKYYRNTTNSKLHCSKPRDFGSKNMHKISSCPDSIKGPDLSINAKIVTEEELCILPEREDRPGKKIPPTTVKVKKWGLMINDEIIKWYTSLDLNQFYGSKRMSTHRKKLALYKEIVRKLNDKPDRSRVATTLQLNACKSNIIEKTDNELNRTFNGLTIDKLSQGDLGRWVIFDDGYNSARGKIKFWNNYYVFVVFKANDDWDNYRDYTGQSCKPEMLKFDDGP